MTVSNVGRPFQADPATPKELSAWKGRPTAAWATLAVALLKKWGQALNSKNEEGRMKNEE
jgi:hypothetical protein